jgi:hypothetical protein
MGVVEEELVGVQLYLAALEFLGKEITAAPVLVVQPILTVEAVAEQVRLVQMVVVPSAVMAEMDLSQQLLVVLFIMQAAVAEHLMLVAAVLEA